MGVLDKQSNRSGENFPRRFRKMSHLNIEKALNRGWNSSGRKSHPPSQNADLVIVDLDGGVRRD
jgi:hypothetical protein